MTEHSLWRFSRALHRAINERQFNEIDSLIDEDVDWNIHGPVDLFPFFGARRGKDAVLEVIRQIADRVRVHRFDREAIMLGLESASSLLRYSLTVLDTNKPLRLRLAGADHVCVQVLNERGAPMNRGAWRALAP